VTAWHGYRQHPPMKDMQAHLEKLRFDALTSRLATDPQKIELFARLAERLMVLASEVERAIKAKANDGT
jgi:hypothetical protein